MAPVRGDKVLITKGPNTGKRGTYDSSAGFVSCYVILEGKTEKQLFSNRFVFKNDACRGGVIPYIFLSHQYVEVRACTRI